MVMAHDTSTARTAGMPMTLSPLCDLMMTYLLGQCRVL